MAIRLNAATTPGNLLDLIAIETYFREGVTTSRPQQHCGRGKIGYQVYFVAHVHCQSQPLATSSSCQ